MRNELGEAAQVSKKESISLLKKKERKKMGRKQIDP